MWSCRANIHVHVLSEEGGHPYVITAKSDCLWLQSSGGLLLLDLLLPTTLSWLRVEHKTCVNTLSVLVQIEQCGTPALLTWRWCGLWCKRWWSLVLRLFSSALQPPPSSREYGWNRLRFVCKMLVQFMAACGLLEWFIIIFEEEEELPWWTMSMTERSFSQQMKPAVAWSTIGLG